jgi:citrate synthase
MGGLGEQLAKLMSARLCAIAEDTSKIPEDRLRKEASAIVSEAHEKGERVPGYGIPLHRMDPRAPKVIGIAKEEGTFGPFGRLGELIEEELAARLGGRTVPMNLDGVGAVVVLDLGLDWRTTRMFLLTPRSVSMGAHYLEEQDQDTTWRHIPANWIDYES